MAPLILLSLVLPLISYVAIFKKTFYQIILNLKSRQDPLKLKWKKTIDLIQQNSNLFFISFWFFIPWIFYSTQLKFHEMRFMTLDYPVMYLIIAWFLVQMIDLYGKKIKVLFYLILFLNISQSTFYYDYSQEEFKRSPHLLYSIRFYNRIATIVSKDLKKTGYRKYSIQLKKGDDPRTEEWLEKLNQHILITARWKLGRSVAVGTSDQEKVLDYQILGDPSEIPGSKNLSSKYLNKIYTVYLYHAD